MGGCGGSHPHLTKLRYACEGVGGASPRGLCGCDLTVRLFNTVLVFNVVSKWTIKTPLM